MHYLGRSTAFALTMNEKLLLNFIKMKEVLIKKKPFFRSYKRNIFLSLLTHLSINIKRFALHFIVRWTLYTTWNSSIAFCHRFKHFFFTQIYLSFNAEWFALKFNFSIPSFTLVIFYRLPIEIGMSNISISHLLCSIS